MQVAQVQAAGDGAQSQPPSSPPDTIQISRRRRLAAEGDSGGGSILMSNPDTANQAEQSTFYLGNAGVATIQNEALAAWVDGLEAKVDGVTTEMRAMGSNLAALTEMLRTALAPGYAKIERPWLWRCSLIEKQFIKFNPAQ